MEKRPPYTVNLLRDTLETTVAELEKEPSPSKWPILAGVAVLLVIAGVAANFFFSGKEKKEDVHPSKFEKKLLATVEVRDVPPPPPAIKAVENRTANKSAEEKRVISELLKGKKLIPTLDTNAEKKATKVVTVTKVKMRLIHKPEEKARALKVLKELNVKDVTVKSEKTLVTFRRVLVGPFKTNAEIKKAKELITDNIQEEFSFWVKRKKGCKYLAVQAFVQEKNSDALVLALVYAVYPLKILGVFGRGFSAGREPLLILTSAQILSVAIGSVGYVLSMTEHQGFFFRATLLSVILNFAGDVLLIPLWGIKGAAVATGFSLVFSKILELLYVRKRLNMWVFSYSVLKGTMLFLGLLILSLFLKSLNPWLPVIFFPIGSVALVSSLMDREDKRIFLSFLSSF